MMGTDNAIIVQMFYISGCCRKTMCGVKCYTVYGIRYATGF